MSSNASPRGTAVLLLAIVIAAWGVNWSVGKVVLEHVTPIWATTLRMVPACIVLWVVLPVSGRLAMPTRHDLPVILSVGLLHMVAFSVLAALGLQYLSAGRSVVLAYTTPLWVLPAARFFLGEAFTARRAAGLGLGVAGLLVLLQPAAVDWRDAGVVAKECARRETGALRDGRHRGLLIADLREQLHGGHAKASCRIGLPTTHRTSQVLTQCDIIGLY